MDNAVTRGIDIGEKIADTDQKNRFDLGVIWRLILFFILSNAVSTPLRIFVEAVIEGKKGAPDFITVGFVIYAVIAEIVVGAGYMILGYRLPVKSTFLRGFCYIMLILVSSYLPNVLAMAGGDGEIIGASLTPGIVAVDTLSYVFKGLFLGLLMRKYDVPHAEVTDKKTGTDILKLCAVNGVLFAVLNIVWDIFMGAFDPSFRLCHMLKVSPQHETRFYIIFAVFMFIAGFIQPVWYRHCMKEGSSVLQAVIFALKLSLIVWLPNVLIMVFFGTPVLLTLAYGGAYTFMIASCVMMYRYLK